MQEITLEPTQVAKTLNDLIELNRDSQKGFREASEKIQAPDIKTYCQEQCHVRAQFVEELQPIVQSLGEEPEDSGSISAALHRGWLDLKSALGGGDHAILEVVESGEDHALREYQKVLANHLPIGLKDILERQYNSIKQTHLRVRAMRDGLKG